jgi:hypothetical protein
VSGAADTSSTCNCANSSGRRLGHCCGKSDLAMYMTASDNDAQTWGGQTDMPVEQQSYAGRRRRRRREVGLRACEHAGFEELLVRLTHDKVDAVIMRPVLLAQVLEADGCGAGDIGRHLPGLRERDVN